MDRAWRATVHGVTKGQTTERVTLSCSRAALGSLLALTSAVIRADKAPGSRTSRPESGDTVQHTTHTSGF